MDVPNWVGRLWVEERARTSGVVKTKPSYVCPANLPNVDIRTIPYNRENIPVCATYEGSSRASGFFPSQEHCPECPYNTDNIRTAADAILAKNVRDFLSLRRKP